MKKYQEILLTSLCVVLVVLFSCSRENAVKDGYYCSSGQYIEKTVYGFILIKNGQYINDHSLYLDPNREKIFREPYHSEIYNVEVIDGNLIVDDYTHSYEVTKESFFGKREVITKPRYRISNCSGKPCLKNIDIPNNVYIYCDFQEKY